MKIYPITNPTKGKQIRKFTAKTLGGIAMLAVGVAGFTKGAKTLSTNSAQENYYAQRKENVVSFMKDTGSYGQAMINFTTPKMAEISKVKSSSPSNDMSHVTFTQNIGEYSLLANFDVVDKDNSVGRLNILHENLDKTKSYNVKLSRIEDESWNVSLKNENEEKSYRATFEPDKENKNKIAVCLYDKENKLVYMQPTSKTVIEPQKSEKDLNKEDNASIALLLAQVLLWAAGSYLVGDTLDKIGKNK